MVSRLYQEPWSGAVQYWGIVGSDLEIVRSVSGNFNVFTEKFLQKREYIGLKAHDIVQIYFCMCSKKQNS